MQQLPSGRFKGNHPAAAATTITAPEKPEQQQQQQQQQQQHLPRLWEGSAEESSYYIPLSSDNGSGSSESSAESGSSSSRSSSNNIDNNILSRLLSLNSNSLSSRSNVKLKPATVFDAGSSTPAQQEQHVAAVPALMFASMAAAATSNATAAEWTFQR